MQEEISINILNKEDVVFSLDLSTTIQEVIEFLVDAYSDSFQNVQKQSIIVKSQNQVTLFPTQTLQQVLTQEKSKKFYVLINQQKQSNPIQQSFPNRNPSDYPPSVQNQNSNQQQFQVNQTNQQQFQVNQTNQQQFQVNQTNQQFQVNQTNQGRMPVQPMQQVFGNSNQQQSQQFPQQQGNFMQQQQPQFNQFTNQSQAVQSQNIQSQQQEISITFIYQNQQTICQIDVSTPLDSLLDFMKENFQITEQVSIFYNNNPLLNLKQTVGQQNLPNNCTIYLKPYVSTNQTAFGQNFPNPPSAFGQMNSIQNQPPQLQKQGSNQNNSQGMTSQPMNPQPMGQGNMIKLQFEIEDGMIKRSCVLNCYSNQQLQDLKMAVLNFIGINTLDIADVDFYFGQAVFGGTKLAKTLEQLQINKDHTTIKAKIRWIGG